MGQTFHMICIEVEVSKYWGGHFSCPQLDMQHNKYEEQIIGFHLFCYFDFLENLKKSMEKKKIQSGYILCNKYSPTNIYEYT